MTERDGAEDLEHQRSLELLILRIAKRLIALATEGIDAGIRRTIEDLARAADAVRASVFLFSEDGETVKNTHEWCADAADSQIAQLGRFPVDMFGYWITLLRKHAEIVIGSPADMPLEARTERQWIATHGFRPMVFVPMVLKGELFGTLGFYGRIGEERSWFENHVWTLSMASVLLTSALERKRSGEALREGAETLRSTISSMEDLVLVLDENRVFRECYQPLSLAELFMPPEQVLGRRHDDVLPPHVSEPLEEAIDLVLAGKGTQQFEYTTDLPSSGPRWFQAKVSLRYGSSAYKHGVTAVVRDITNFRRAEENARKFQLLVETSSDFIGIASLDGTVLFINDAGLNMVGIEPGSDLASLQIADFLTEEGRVASAEVEVPAVTKTGRWSGETTLRHFKTGETIPVLTSSFLVTTSNNEPICLATVQRNISELKRVQEEQARASAANLLLLDQAREDAEMKTRLLEEINHRVKNNLASIIGLLFAYQRFAREEEKPAVGTIVKDLTGRIEALSVVHRQLSSTSWAPLALSGLADDVIRSTLQPFTHHKEIAIAITPSSILLAAKQANSIGLVLHELATNSLKHGFIDGQKACINLDIVARNDKVLVTYSDDGQGYSDDILAGRAGGTGLYLTKKLVESDLSGTLELRNDDGAVARITFRHGSKEVERQ